MTSPTGNLEAREGRLAPSRRAVVLAVLSSNVVILAFVTGRLSAAVIAAAFVMVAVIAAVSSHDAARHHLVGPAHQPITRWAGVATVEAPRAREAAPIQHTDAA